MMSSSSKVAETSTGVLPPWRRVLVYGLGGSGQAAAVLLATRGVSVLGYDEGEPGQHGLGEAGDAFVELILGDDAPELSTLKVDALVLSPGVPATRPLVAQAREQGIPVLAEVELAYLALEPGTDVLAITGSNGKSTTTELCGALLRGAGLPVAVCGNIGEPMSRQVALATESSAHPLPIFVVELSSFQLETTQEFHPRVAALLNLAPDHLDRYPSYNAYCAAKERIFLRQGNGDTAVLNADDERVTALQPASRVRRFSLEGPVADGCFLRDGEVIEVSPKLGERALFEASQLALVGRHNLMNAMAAALMVRSIGVEPDSFSKTLEEFTGLPHRVQDLGELRGVRFIDDSKGTNMAATAESLRSFADGTVHLILGGKNKDADPSDLRELVAQKAPPRLSDRGSRRRVFGSA